MTPELKIRYGRLMDFVREHLHGGCKVLSRGDACECLLCDLEALQDALCPETALPAEHQKAHAALDAVIQKSQETVSAWQRAIDAYQIAIDTITRMQEAQNVRDNA